jgi:MFS family permease
MLAAFEAPAFRWLWLSHHLYSISLMMGRLALGWLVLTQTDSAFWVGMAGGLEGVGKVGFGLLAGALVDRWDRRSAMMLSQALSGLAALALGALIVAGRVALWHILLAALVQGAADALNASASNALLFQIVGRGRMINASAATLFSFNLARITGSAAAGALIARWDTGICYLALGAVACAALAPAAFFPGRFKASVTAEPLLRAMLGGLRHAWTQRPLRHLLSLSVVMEGFGFAHFAMVPVIARDVLGVGAAELGWLSSAGGLGALAGALLLAWLGDYPYKGRLLLSAAGASAAGLIAFAFSRWYGLSVALAVFLGASLVAYDVLMHALFQLLAGDEMRGRVFSLYVLTFGFASLGGLLMGTLASLAGAPLAVGLGGGVIGLFLLGRLRPLGELRPMAEEAVQPASD